MLKKIFFWMVSCCLSLFLLEVLVSAILIHSYRLYEKGLENEKSQFSLVNIVHLIGDGFGLIELNDQIGYEFRKTTKPETFNIADSLLGYTSKPGEYQRIYQRKRLKDEDWESLKVKVTINPDGSRWTGSLPSILNVSRSNAIASKKGTINIYGDSFVFGIGVNDEHTFSYLTQQALPEYQVNLFALGGYSLTQALINFEKHKRKLVSGDIVILGYADFYNARQVLSPAHLQTKQHWFAKHSPESISRNFLLPRILVDKQGQPYVDYVYENCALNNGYCEQANPSEIEMAETSASIINYISSQTKADVYVLHIRGKKDDPVFGLLNHQIRIIHATEDDFDYYIKDDIEGFDQHPGPYWHFAISRRLIETIQSSDVSSK